MNREQRVEALKELLEKPLKINFSQAHKRIEMLIQRPVWTHEMAFPELLYAEIRSGKKGSAFGKSLVEATKLTKGKKVSIMIPSEAEGVPLGFKAVAKIDLSKKKDEKRR